MCLLRKFYMRRCNFACNFLLRKWTEVKLSIYSSLRFKWNQITDSIQLAKIETKMSATIFDSNTSNMSRRPQYLACGILCISGFLGGTVTGWASPALPSLESTGDFENLTTTTLSWVASMALLGTVVGSPIGGYLIKKFGRKGTLLLSSVPFFIGWTALAFPCYVWMLHVGRFLSGVAMTWKVLAGSVYLSEIAEPGLRGSLIVIWFVSIRLGVIFDYGIGSVLSYDKLSGISAIISVVFAVSTLFLPESPRWLMSKWQKQKAIDSLCWLRACDNVSPSPKIIAEINEIQEAVLRADKEKKDTLSSISSYFTNRVVLKSLILASILMCFKDACGGNALSYYVVKIFEQTGSALDPHVSGVVIGIAQLVGILLTTVYVDKVGRRILLIGSYLVMTLSLVFMGLFYQFKTEIESVIQYSGWIPFIVFMAYLVGYSEGPFVLAWTLTSEIIPTNVIGSVTGLATTVGWGTAFVLTRYFEDMKYGIGLSNTFWVFAVFAAGGAISTHMLVPETVGKTLENIHRGADNNSDERGQNNTASV